MTIIMDAVFQQKQKRKPIYSRTPVTRTLKGNEKQFELVGVRVFGGSSYWGRLNIQFAALICRLFGTSVCSTVQIKLISSETVTGDYAFL